MDVFHENIENYWPVWADVIGTSFCPT